MPPRPGITVASVCPPCQTIARCFFVASFTCPVCGFLNTMLVVMADDVAVTIGEQKKI